MKLKGRTKGLLYFIGISLALIIIGIICILYLQEYLFFPKCFSEASYNELLTYSNQEYEEFKIDNNGDNLNGWVRFNVSPEKKSPLLIFFVGNYQDSSGLLVNFAKNDMYKYFENYNIMAIDYPGYGLSDGAPSDKTMFDAAIKTYDYAINQEYVDTDNIVVLGYSIGTGVATYLASERNVSGLILVSPYDRALSLYNDALNIFYGPIKLLAKYKFNSIEYAPKISVAPLIFTSYNDGVINYKFSLNLAKHFKNVYKTVVLENVTHVGYFNQEEVLNDIYGYLQNVLQKVEN